MAQAMKRPKTASMDNLKMGWEINKLQKQCCLFEVEDRSLPDRTFMRRIVMNKSDPQ
jgi:hypothetical protein